MANITVSANVDTMLQAANNAAIRTAIGAGDVTLAGTQTITGAKTFSDDIEINVNGASNSSKAIVINTSGTNFESDTGIIEGTHAATGAYSGGTWLRFRAGGVNRFRVQGDGDLYFAAGTASGTAVQFANPVSSLCPELRMTRQGGSTSGNDFIKLDTSAGEVFSVDAAGGIDCDNIATVAGVVVGGALSKASGTFRIPHPLPEKTKTHNLVHSFIEGPQADLIYRGKVKLVEGSATVNIDTESGMTNGTFVTLCRDIQSFTTNESGWIAVKSNVDGNILTIESQDASTDSISWMVIGERQDVHMYDTDWTDENGKPIIEPLIDSIDSGGQSPEVIAEEERLDAEIRNKQNNAPVE